VVDQILVAEIYDRLLRDDHALAVFTYLRGQNGADAEFMITDTMGKKEYKWARRRVPAGRRVLLELKLIEKVRDHRKGLPALRGRACRGRRLQRHPRSRSWEAENYDRTNKPT
jgi:hypothetical protein